MGPQFTGLKNDQQVHEPVIERLAVLRMIGNLFQGSKYETETGGVKNNLFCGFRNPALVYPESYQDSFVMRVVLNTGSGPLRIGTHISCDLVSQ